MEKRNFESSPEINLSEREKRNTEIIERLPLTDFDKVDMLLILQNLKQATDIRIYSDRNKDFEQSLKELGLVGLLGKKEKLPDSKKTSQEFYVAKTGDIAKRLKNAWQTLDDAELGALSGYPQSAVESFIKSKSLTGSEEEVAKAFRELFIGADIPEDVRHEDYLAFLNFQLSRDNFRQELEVVRSWAEEIRRLDPSLFERVVDWHRNK